MKKIYMGGMIDENERTVNLKDVIEIIDEQVEFLKQQNGMGAIMGMLKMFDADNVKKVINTNNDVIKELMTLRMKRMEALASFENVKNVDEKEEESESDAFDLLAEYRTDKKTATV